MGPELSHRRAIVLLGSVFMVAGCGLAYELTMSTAAAFFLGDTVFQFSLTIGIFLAALGLGAFISRRIQRDLLRAFVLIEIAIAAIGGLSAGVIYLSYGWSYSIRGVTILFPILVGTLVGMEIPLLTRILAWRDLWKDAISNVLSFDYLGGLAAALLYPLVLLPGLGIVRSAIVFGVLNGVTGLGTAIVFRKDSPKIRRLIPLAAFTLALLIGALAVAGTLVRGVEKVATGGTVIAAFRTLYQRVVLSQHPNRIELFLDGHLQFSSADEARYHEAFAHPVMGATPARRSILIIGGGDGLLAREIFRYPEVKRVTLVDIDKELVRFCRTEKLIALQNKGALSDPRLTFVAADGFVWLQRSAQRFDRIFLDLPDPRTEGVARLYSVEFFSIMRKHLRPNGVVAVQATTPYYLPRVFWSIVTSMEQAGLSVVPAHVNVPSLGEWGFAFGSIEKRQYHQAPIPKGLAFLSPAVLPTLFAWPLDLPRLKVKANHFDRPVILDYYTKDTQRWRGLRSAKQQDQ